MRTSIEILEDVKRELDSFHSTDEWYGYLEDDDGNEVNIRWESLRKLHVEIYRYIRDVNGEDRAFNA